MDNSTSVFPFTILKTMIHPNHRYINQQFYKYSNNKCYYHIVIVLLDSKDYSYQSSKYH